MLNDYDFYYKIRKPIKWIKLPASLAPFPYFVDKFKTRLNACILGLNF